MAEERYDRNHHAGANAEERIRNRFKTCAEPQRGSGAQVKLGEGPTRTVTTVHPSGNTRKHGSDDPGAPDIHGNKRGAV